MPTDAWTHGRTDRDVCIFFSAQATKSIYIECDLWIDQTAPSAPDALFQWSKFWWKLKCLWVILRVIRNTWLGLGWWFIWLDYSYHRKWLCCWSTSINFADASWAGTHAQTFAHIVFVVNHESYYSVRTCWYELFRIDAAHNIKNVFPWSDEIKACCTRR